MYYEISSRPSFGENENYYFVVPVYDGVFDLEELCRYATHATSLTSADMKAANTVTAEAVADALASADKVQRWRVRMMMTTAGMMRAMASATCQVKGSAKRRQPMPTAVSGSSAPMTAVIVLPMRFTETTRQRFVTTVQMSASEPRSTHCEP